MNIKKIACGALGAALLLSATACSGAPVKDAGDANVSELATQAEKSPKYVFLFIGDGMSYPQFQAASDYLGALADKLHSQKDWKVGIISSVNLNHATPAAFYAHQASRNNYYEIGEELVNSGFEYFAGGGLKKVTGPEKDKTSLYDLAADAGATVNDTLALADASADDYTQEQYVLYGTYNPFSVTVTHILNNKSGVDFTSYSHTGLPVAVFANDAGANAFVGYYDNTDTTLALSAPATSAAACGYSTGGSRGLRRTPSTA